MNNFTFLKGSKKNTSFQINEIINEAYQILLNPINHPLSTVTPNGQFHILSKTYNLPSEDSVEVAVSGTVICTPNFDRRIEIQINFPDGFNSCTINIQRNHVLQF